MKSIFIRIFSIPVLAVLFTQIGLYFFYQIHNQSGVPDHINRFLFYNTVFVILISAILSYFASTSIARPLLHLLRRIRKFPEATASSLPTTRIQEIHELNDRIEEFMGQMKTQLKDLNLEKELLSSLLNSLKEGVLCLNSEGVIIFKNNAIDPDLVSLDATGRSYLKVVKHPTMLECINTRVNNQNTHRSDRITTETYLNGNGSFTYEHEEGIDPSANEEPKSPGTNGDAPLAFNHNNKFFKMMCYPIVMENRLELFLIIIHDDTREQNTQRLRQDFLQNASHELKTPVTSIRGYSETMLYRIEGEREKGFISAILRNVSRMERIIEDMVTISSLESGAFPFNPEVIHVSEFMEDIRELVTGTLNQKMQRLSMHVEPSVRNFHADPLLMEHLLLNLIVNASRYSPEESDINVLCKESENGKAIILSVTDQGPGVEEAYFTKIFERFFRVDNNRSRMEGGTGLGLSIVRQITRIHGGKVWVENLKDHGGGSRFSVLIPR